MTHGVYKYAQALTTHVMNAGSMHWVSTFIYTYIWDCAILTMPDFPQNSVPDKFGMNHIMAPYCVPFRVGPSAGTRRAEHRITVGHTAPSPGYLCGVLCTFSYPSQLLSWQDQECWPSWVEKEKEAVGAVLWIRNFSRENNFSVSFFLLQNPFEVL